MIGLECHVDSRSLSCVTYGRSLEISKISQSYCDLNSMKNNRSNYLASCQWNVQHPTSFLMSFRCQKFTSSQTFREFLSHSTRENCHRPDTLSSRHWSYTQHTTMQRHHFPIIIMWDISRVRYAVMRSCDMKELLIALFGLFLCVLESFRPTTNSG